MFKKADIIFYLCIIFIGIYPFITNKDNSSKQIVRIQIGRSYSKFISLSRDTIFSIDTLNASFSVGIKNNTVKLIESACQNQLCVKQGAIDKNSFRSIICLPQKIIIDICSKKDIGNIKVEKQKESIIDAVAE